MKKTLLTLLFAFTALFAAAQLTGPNASAYNRYTDKYYITNYWAGTVTEIDRSGNKTTFISGLKAPNNILFGILPFGSGFLVLDSNEVKVYDSTGDYLATQTVSGAKKLQDCVFDDAAGVLYTSDVLRGVIYKTTFGPAPFYIPSTSVFASGIARPSAMILQKSKNRILFVQDTTASDLKALNLSSGTVSSLRSLGLNNVIGLAEDGQGNLYISSQGDKYIYQLNRFYAGSPVKLISEPRPGDLTVNVSKDEWVYTCVLCGTVFIPRMHVFGPGNEQLLCRKDSFDAYRNILQKCIGTFEPGNEFIMELGNLSGGFGTPVFLAKTADTLVPDLIASRLPSTVKPGNYRYRWRSTKPAITGTSETFTVHPDPTLFVSGNAHSDTVSVCRGSVLTLGEGNTSDPDITYQWQPAGEVDTPANRIVRTTVNTGFRIRVSAVSATTGCKAYDSAWLAPVAAPDGGAMDDTIDLCFGDTALLGSPAAGGLSYRWEPAILLLDDSTLARPRSVPDAPAWFRRTVTAAGGCSSTDSQFVMVHPRPVGFLNTNTLYFECRGERKSLWFVSRPAGTSLKWQLPGLADETGDSFHITNSSESLYGTGKVEITQTKTGCRNTQNFTVRGLPHYFTFLTRSGDTGLIEMSARTVSRRWYRNDTLLSDTGRMLLPQQSGFYKACGTTLEGCEECSIPVWFTPAVTASNIKVRVSGCLPGPNPVVSVVRFPCFAGKPTPEWQVFDTRGRCLLKGKGTEADLSALPAGVYLLQLPGSRHTLVKP